MRLCLWTLVYGLFLASTISAAQIKAPLKSLEAAKRSVTLVSDDGTEKTFSLESARIKFQGKELKDREAQKMFDTVAATIKHQVYTITLELEGDKVSSADICLQKLQK